MLQTGADGELRGKESAMSDNAETAILAGGCFWGVQELLREREGVISTGVGYTGGENDNPSYGNHPGHAEAVEIVFDPERISYRDILEFFFQIHDPTTKDRQGNDVGSSYEMPPVACMDSGSRSPGTALGDRSSAARAGPTLAMAWERSSRTWVRANRGPASACNARSREQAGVSRDRCGAGLRHP
jgi:Peptide methionine sulfoxide reductase